MKKVSISGGDISLKEVKDRDDIIYKPIHNYFNHFCYFITCIQRLHSSSTLNKLVQTNVLNDFKQECENILYLLRHYDKANDEDPKYKDIIQTFFHQSTKSGGCPQTTLTQLFIPVIYQLYGKDRTLKVMQEINLQFKHFRNTVEEKEFIYTTNTKFNKQLYLNYQQLLKEEEYIPLSQFKVGTLCLFFKSVYNRNTADENAGHAITIVQDCNHHFFVIDDSHAIVPFDKYVEYIYDTMYEIELKDIDDDSLQFLIDDCKQYKDKLYFNKRIYRVVIKPKRVVMSGGSKRSKYNKSIRGGTIEYKMSDKVELVDADKQLQDNAKKQTSSYSKEGKVAVMIFIILFTVFVVVMCVVLIVSAIRAYMNSTQENNTSNQK